MQRKTVSVLFCDVTGSTTIGEAIDPEALRGLLARYFERMKAIAERHGGTVEKFIGDAVVAVFGVPVAHEDDALRAVRAAAEMRDALPGIGVQARIGVNTGEIVTVSDERLVIGDAVNVAARLEQTAQPGEVLIGAATRALVGGAAEVEELEPLRVKGKAAPVTAYRLLRVGEAPERRHDAPFVGRQRERTLLNEAWRRAQAERRCEVVTVVGDPGVGKSRLMAEFLASVDATVVRGRCLPYGEGITYWPVVEVLRQLGSVPTEGPVAAAIGSLVGQNAIATSSEEIAWAVRKVLEHAARERPLAVVLDDIQWGEETFLDLVEHIALLSSGAPLLLLCMARPELLERRPAWPVSLRLQPLAENEVDELIPDRITGNMRDRIARAAGGSPLFIAEMVAVADEAKGDVVVPPTLQALLGARLDQLDPPERMVLERGAVEGEVFHRGAVQALAPDEEHVTRRLAALVRREFIRPDASQVRGEDGFRFRHLLFRDAAYEALPKATRAQLHERFAAWLDAHGADVVELDEIVGYHLEQACRYASELGSSADDELRRAAHSRLAAAGRRAYARADHRAAAGLLRRAAALTRPDEIDLALEVTLIDAVFESGNVADAVDRARALAERGRSGGDRVAELCGRIWERLALTYLEPEGATERLAATVDQVLPELEAAGEDTPLYVACYAEAMVAAMRGHMDAMAAAADKALAHARQVVPSPTIRGWRSFARLYGTTPVPQFLAWLDGEEARAPANVLLRQNRALAFAMLGRFDEARATLADVRAELADRGAWIQAGVATGIVSVDVEHMAGDPATAVRLGEEACTLLGDLGERSIRSSAAAYLARAYLRLERLDDADLWARRAAELGASDDALTQMLWREVRARVLALRGAHAEAEQLAGEAVAIGDAVQGPGWQADAYADLAEVLVCAGRAADAVAALEKSLARYQQKGIVVMAERVRERIAEVSKQ